MYQRRRHLFFVLHVCVWPISEFSSTFALFLNWNESCCGFIATYFRHFIFVKFSVLHSQLGHEIWFSITQNATNEFYLNILKDASDVIVLHWSMLLQTLATISLDLDVNFRHILNTNKTLHNTCVIKFNVVKRYERSGSVNRLLRFVSFCYATYRTRNATTAHESLFDMRKKSHKNLYEVRIHPHKWRTLRFGAWWKSNCWEYAPGALHPVSFIFEEEREWWLVGIRCNNTHILWKDDNSNSS